MPEIESCQEAETVAAGTSQQGGPPSGIRTFDHATQHEIETGTIAQGRGPRRQKHTVSDTVKPPVPTTPNIWAKRLFEQGGLLRVVSCTDQFSSNPPKKNTQNCTQTSMPNEFC